MSRRNATLQPLSETVHHQLRQSAHRRNPTDTLSSEPAGQQTYVQLVAENDLLQSRINELVKWLDELKVTNLTLTADKARLRVNLSPSVAAP